MLNYVLYCIVFKSYSFHWHYIKFDLQEYAIILVTMHEMTKMHNSYSAQVTQWRIQRGAMGSNKPMKTAHINSI